MHTVSSSAAVIPIIWSVPFLDKDFTGVDEFVQLAQAIKNAAGSQIQKQNQLLAAVKFTHSLVGLDINY